MTATERLRQLLDERGVEWEPIDGCAATYVEHNGEAWQFDYDEHFDQICLVWLSGYTPEQAVEATLGRGTCKMEATLTNPFETRIDEYHCSECGEYCSVEKVMGKTEPPKFCPNCGRKVEE